MRFVPTVELKFSIRILFFVYSADHDLSQIIPELPKSLPALE